MTSASPVAANASVSLHGLSQAAFNLIVECEVFLAVGGSVAEYGAGRDHALAQGWFTMHISGVRFVLPD